MFGTAWNPAEYGLRQRAGLHSIHLVVAGDLFRDDNPLAFPRPAAREKLNIGSRAGSRVPW
jgi:hypothetical protein